MDGPMGVYTLEDIALAIDGRISGGDPQLVIDGPAPFETATASQITFAGQAKFLRRLTESKAGAVIVPEGTESAGIPVVVVANPMAAFARVVGLFFPPERPPPGIHPRAHIGDGLTAGADVYVGPGAVVSDGVTLGDRAVVHPGVFLGRQVSIGADTELFPNVTILARCRIGSRVIVHAGTVIGSDGFGFAPEGDGYVKIPHTGIVRIEDDVEIGANNTIDRATMGETVIQRGVKTDNLVQVAHNVVVGENTVLVAQVGIAGSTTIGKHAILAGQVGVSGHLSVGNNVTIGPQSGIAQSVPDNQIVTGSPAMPHRLYLRVQRTLQKLPELKRRIVALEKRMGIPAKDR